MTRAGAAAIAVLLGVSGAAAQAQPTAEVLVRQGHGARVHIGSDVRVAEHERVDAAVAVFGSVTVDGEVNDDVVAVGGDVNVGSTGVVHGSVTSVGGTLTVAPEARIFGSRQEVAVRIPDVNVRWPDWPQVSIAPIRIGRWWTGVALSATLARMLLVGLVALFTILVAQGPILRLGARVARAGGEGEGAPLADVGAERDAQRLAGDGMARAQRDRSLGSQAAARLIGLDQKVVIDAMVAEVQTRLDEKVADGSMTADEAAARLADITERITERVDTAGMPGPGDHGDDHGDDHGRGHGHGGGETPPADVTSA